MKASVLRECLVGGVSHLLREVGSGDTAAVLSLFARVFGTTPPPGWHEWKYGAHGLAGRAMGLWTLDGRLVAHYAGFPRRLLWHGEALEAIQIGDVMVAPEQRGLLTRRGPFFQVCAAFFERWVGPGKPFALAFGFPNDRAMRLGEKLGLYEDLGAIERLVWPAAPVPSPKGWQAKETDIAAARLTARAWRQMTTDSPQRIYATREPDYLWRRFAIRPGVTHRFITLRRRWFGPTALAILTTAGTALRWLDFIGPRMALSAAVATLQGLAARCGAAEVECWASAAARDDFLATGARPAGIAARFALARASSCPDDTLAQAGWWLAGDTDFL